MRPWCLKPINDALWRSIAQASGKAQTRTFDRFSIEFGLRVRQRKAYDEALTHSSMLDGDKTGLKSNERQIFG